MRHSLSEQPFPESQAAIGRPVVDFLIIGAQKAGTTAAAFNFAKHPQIFVFQGVTTFGQREIEFFNQHWNEGVSWYRTHFSYKQKRVGEKTAELLHRTITHQRMFETAPDAKLIVFLRCPVERAYSQWKMATRPRWGENRSFSEVVADELTNVHDEQARCAVYECHNSGLQPWREGYLIKGFYAEQLLHILKWYPRMQLYVAITERVRRNMAREYNKIFDFLGVDRFQGEFEERFVGNPAPAMDLTVRRALIDLYRPHNKMLFELLGYSIDEWAK